MRSPPPLPATTSIVTHAIAIDDEIWNAFGGSEEAIQKALRKIAEAKKPKKKTGGALATLKKLFKTKKTPKKRAKAAKTSKKSR